MQSLADDQVFAVFGQSRRTEKWPQCLASRFRLLPQRLAGFDVETGEQACVPAEIGLATRGVHAIPSHNRIGEEERIFGLKAP